MLSTKPISLDGSTLEGGGQLVRVALSLSAITGTPIHIYNIRANRAPRGRSVHRPKNPSTSRHSNNSTTTSSSSSKPEGGLKESHLAALQYLAHACNAYVEGDEVGSREVLFIPGRGSESKSPKAQSQPQLVNFETGTIELQRPGSVWLIMQALLPYLIFGNHDRLPSTNTSASVATAEPNVTSTSDSNSLAARTIELLLRGGTNVSQSMSGEYIHQILLPTLLRIGLPPIQVDIAQRGWAGPAPGLGEVRLRVSHPPQNFSLPGFEIQHRGEIAKITATIIAADTGTSDKLQSGLRRVIAQHFGVEMVIEVPAPMEQSGDGRRLYVLLVAHTTNGWRLGRDYLGTGRQPRNDADLDRIVDAACQTVVRGLKSEVKRGGCVDEFLQDQLVVFQALACGGSSVDGGVRGGMRERPEVERENGGGSLHARTVRWVCGEILGKRGVEFVQGGGARGVGWNKEDEG